MGKGKFQLETKQTYSLVLLLNECSLVGQGGELEEKGNGLGRPPYFGGPHQVGCLVMTSDDYDYINMNSAPQFRIRTCRNVFFLYHPWLPLT